MYKIILVSLMMCVGCASTGAPGGDPCRKRSFDDWVSYYALRDKAQSSWDEGYAPAYGWLEDVVRACHPERFEEEGDVSDDHEGLNEVHEQDGSARAKREEEERPAYEVPQGFLQIEAADVPSFEEEE